MFPNRMLTSIEEEGRKKDSIQRKHKNVLHRTIYHFGKIWRLCKYFNNQKSPKSKLQTIPDLNVKMNFNFSTLLF